jgi:hypothetical protein
MDKALLVDLKKKIFIRSALLSIPSLDELLGLNDYLSADEVLLELIKKALREYENSVPLILEMRLNRNQLGTCFGREGWAEIKSNFTLYLDCILPEESIVLVPNSLPYIRVGGSLSYPSPGSYFPATDYQRPYLFMGDLMGNTDFYIKAICSRPIIPDFLPDKTFNADSKKAAIYWLNIEEGARGNYFMDLCMVHVLDFLRQLKASMMLPNAPVDIMQQLDPAYSELRSRCDQFQLQSSWYGEFLI